MENVSQQSIEKMLHALGIQYTKRGKEVEPNKKYNPLPISYRNYYQTALDQDWENLISMGYAVKGQHCNLNWYCVTSEGKEFLKQLGYRFKVERQQ